MSRKFGRRGKKLLTHRNLRSLSVIRLIPNVATIFALCIGISSIRFSLMGNYEIAVIAILVAGLLDALDGSLARLLGVDSDFGAELDSLSDFVSFGVAPSMVIYIVSLEQWGGIGWAFSLMFCICMALRLARFNIQSKLDKNENDILLFSGYFVGVPAPAAACLGCFPLILEFALQLNYTLPTLIYSMFIIFSAILMVSNIPTFSLKYVKIPRNRVGFVLLLSGLLITVLINALWETVAVLGVVYLITIPISFWFYKRSYGSFN